MHIHMGFYRTREILGSTEFLHRVEHRHFRYFQVLETQVADMSKNYGISTAFWELDGISNSFKYVTTLTYTHSQCSQWNLTDQLQIMEP